MQSSFKDRLTTRSKSRSNSTLRPSLRPLNKNSKRQLPKRHKHPCLLTLVELNPITSNTSKARMIRMIQSRHQLRNLHMKRLLRSREVARLRFSNNNKKFVLPEEETPIVSSLLRRSKTETAMMRKMWSSQRKRVRRTNIKIDAISAIKQAACCVVMAVLKWHTWHALASRSHRKETGIARIAL